jgi:hypothetical protein
VSEVDLTAPEVQAAIAAAVEKATAPLVAKRDELLGEVKKLRKNAEIDPADLEKVEAERDALKQQLNDAQKAAKKATADLEAANKARDELNAAFTGSLKEAALTDALTKAGVTNPAYLKAAKALLSGAVEVAEENGQRVVKAGDKALGDFITEWAGDEGKHFRANGAEGGNASPGQSNTTPSGQLPPPDDKAARAAVFAQRLANATD